MLVFWGWLPISPAVVVLCVVWAFLVCSVARVCDIDEQRINYRGMVFCVNVAFTVLNEINPFVAGLDYSPRQ